MALKNASWRLAYAPHSECARTTLTSIADIEKSGFDTLSATVPGNFENDLMNAGRLPDLYYSTNTLAAQRLENRHIWYYTTFDAESTDSYLHFEGIDTLADIYVNGELAAVSENMYLPVDVYGKLHVGSNEVVIHIKPVCIETRRYPLPVSCSSLKYNYPAISVRKAPHMFGWDIMPRIVSAGIWKDVHLEPMKKDKINEVFFLTHTVDLAAQTAGIIFYLNADLSGDFANDYTVRVYGACGERSFSFEEKLWHNSARFNKTLQNVAFWWPKNYGEPNLYQTTVELLYQDAVVDRYVLNVGFRTVALDMTDSTDDAGNGAFGFRINGKKIFALGTNWVPLDALHANDINRLDAALALLEDIGCNMVRCWGGNVYESDEFFDFCDAHGIMVWQDFAMACTLYPQDGAFIEKLREEAVYEVKRLRNHVSLTLWAGDNECDSNYFEWEDVSRDPNNNILTREVLRRVLLSHDYSRPYLPSSPYISRAVVEGKGIRSENHLWGPRDYFKGDFYKNTFCHFASEIGYHGFPSESSLKKFLAHPEKVFEKDFIPTDEYLVHAAGAETDAKNPYAYRIKLAYDQVVTLFGSAQEDFADFLKQSQISQAEAKKFFIEKFRINKQNRTGILWWNLIDGWP